MHKSRFAVAAIVFASGAASSVASFGCSRRNPEAPVSPPPAVRAGSPVALPDGGMHHTVRLAEVSWGPGGAFTACGRRTSDFTRPGLPGACLSASPGDGGTSLSDGGAARRDTSPVESGPGACRILLDDVPGDPGAPPARATLYGPAGHLLLDAWRPPRTVDGDYFAIETSLSPDGRWLGLVHTSVGRGEGEQRVDVISVAVVPAPPCK